MKKPHITDYVKEDAHQYFKDAKAYEAQECLAQMVVVLGAILLGALFHYCG